MYPGRICTKEWRAQTDSNNPVHNLQVRYQRGYGQAFRPGGIRLFLHPAPEPHKRLCSSKNCRAGGRHSRNPHIIRPGCQLLCCIQHCHSRRPCGFFRCNLRRHLQPFQRDNAEDGNRLHLRFTRCVGRRDPGCIQAQHQVCVRRDHCKPCPYSIRYRKMGKDST